MALTTAPLFSLDARGSLAKTLTYSKQRGQTYTKAYAVPDNPNTPAQQSIRHIIRLITQSWYLVSEEDRATWDELAELLNLSPYHAYLKTNAQRWQHFLLPSARLPITGELTWETANLLITHYDDYDHLYANINNPTDDPFTLAIARSVDDPFIPDKTKIILLSADWTGAESEYLFETDTTPPFPTTHYYQILIAGKSGSQSTWYEFSEEV